MPLSDLVNSTRAPESPEGHAHKSTVTRAHPHPGYAVHGWASPSGLVYYTVRSAEGLDLADAGFRIGGPGRRFFDQAEADRVAADALNPQG